MQLTDEQRAQFRSLATPLIQFLRDNCHPHVTVIIDNQSAELLEGISAFTVPSTGEKPE